MQSWRLYQYVMVMSWVCLVSSIFRGHNPKLITYSTSTNQKSMYSQSHKWYTGSLKDTSPNLQACKVIQNTISIIIPSSLPVDILVWCQPKSFTYIMYSIPILLNKDNIDNRRET